MIFGVLRRSRSWAQTPWPESRHQRRSQIAVVVL